MGDADGGRPPRTQGQRWRFRRDVVIYVAHRNGVSQRVLSDVFGLARSRVQAILADVAAMGDAAVAASETGPPDGAPGVTPRAPCLRRDPRKTGRRRR